MADLSTHYMGLSLKSPVIASSSGLTDNLDNLITLEKYGAGAVVLKSVFEEEIVYQVKENLQKMRSYDFLYPETMSYFDYDDMEDSLASYLTLIKEAKKHLQIPVIASVNCVTAQKWTHFAKELQTAGADAIELNAFILPSDFSRTSQANEQIYFDIIDAVLKEVKIPVSLKLSYYFSNLGPMFQELSRTGISSMVLFNRFYSPDFDIQKEEVIATHVLSQPNELAMPLRWVAILADNVECELAASTGVHRGEDVVKLLLGGAQVVQTASVLYKKGLSYMSVLLNELNQWMDAKGYQTIDDFRGRLSLSRSHNAAALERVQFMKFFRDREKVSNV